MAEMQDMAAHGMSPPENTLPMMTGEGPFGPIEMGGMLQLIRRELEVLCLPGNIPEFIEIDITELNIGDSVHVEDVKLEGDVEIPHDVDFTILTILSAIMAEEEEEENECDARFINCSFRFWLHAQCTETPTGRLH